MPVQEMRVWSLCGEDPLEKEMVNLLQYSCQENPMDRGVWEAPVHGITRVGHNLATKQQKTLGYCLDYVAFNIMGFLKSHKKQETYL